MLDLLQETLLYIEQQHDCLVNIQSLNEERQQKYNILHLKITFKIIEELTKHVSSEIVVDKIDVTREQLHGDTAATCNLISDNETLDDNFDHDAIDKGNSSQALGQEASALKQYKAPHELNSISQKYIIKNTKGLTSNINEDLLDEINSNSDYEKDESEDNNDGDSNLFPVFHQARVKQKRANVTKRLYQCMFCDKICKQKSQLTIHERIHTGEKPFKCSVCNKAFRDKSHLAKHTSVHTVEKRYKCPICNKLFRLSGHLKIHMLIHTGEKPYNCSVCNRPFGIKNNLVRHMRIHTGEKPFSCSYCKKQFREKHTLTKHILIHTGEKSFKCEYCEKIFRQQGAMVIHLRTHTGEKPYTCSHCNRSFARGDTLSVHMKIHASKT